MTGSAAAQAAPILLCDCEGSMPLDGTALARACSAAGLSAAPLATQLCRSQLERFTRALQAGDQGQPLYVACTQEAPLFAEEADAAGSTRPLQFLNIRERAGWSDEGAAATPKIAALIAEAVEAAKAPPVPTLPVRSEGVALVYGRDETAIALARQLGTRLDVTVLLDRPGEVYPPRETDIPVLKGTIVRAKGTLGAFEITVNDYARPRPSSRGALSFEEPRNGAVSRCDIVIDIAGGNALFPAHDKRDGYVRADPRDPAAVQRAAFAATELVGEFEKPLYVRYDATICAHSRSKKTGCTRCLGACPTGAITSLGDKIAIDAMICAGCGSCASVCPTGAAAYTAPAADSVLARLRALLGAYAEAGGVGGVVLFHDGSHGLPLIDMLARAGEGLPARVLPFQLGAVTQLSLEAVAAAIAYGASEVRVLAGRKHQGEMLPVAQALGLAETVLQGLGYGEGRVGLIDADDPDALGQALLPFRQGEPVRGAGAEKNGTVARFLPLGNKRGLSLLALRALHDRAPAPVPVLPLPSGAPFGRVEVRVDGCTLCLACVAACPTGALQDDPGKPKLSFVEDACVQCGLCKNTCPEKVITLVPQLDFTPAARSPKLIKEEEPFHCVACGKPFGTKSSIERIVATLSGKHWMFQEEAMQRRIRMCADCRVVDQTRSALDPYAGPARPATRSAKDYLSTPEGPPDDPLEK